MANLIIAHNKLLYTTSVYDSILYRSTDGIVFSSQDVNFRIAESKVLSVSNVILLTVNEFSIRDNFESTTGKYSTDGGLTWLDSTGLPLEKIDVVNVNSVGANICYLTLRLLSNQGTQKLYKTTNGGATWAYVSDLPSFSIYAFDWISENEGYLLSNLFQVNEVYYTNDGGVTFTLKNSSIPKFIRTIYHLKVNAFVSGVVYVSGIDNSTGNVVIYKSLDSGSTFTVQSTSSDLLIIKALDETTLLSSSTPTGLGVLRVSTDSGATFTATTMPATSNLDIGSATEIYTTDNGNIYFSTDLGATFNTFQKDVDGTVFHYDSLSSARAVSGCLDINAYNFNSNATVDDASCLYAFKLTDTNNPANIIIVDPLLVGPSPVSYVGQAIKINGDDFTCYLVEWSDTIVGAVALTSIDSDYIDGAACELTIPILGCNDSNALNYDPLATQDDGSCTYAYKLTDSRGVEQPIVSQDVWLNAYVGQVVKITSFPNVCWFVTYQTTLVNTNPVSVTYDSDYADIPTCELTFPSGYKLTDVAGNAVNIITDSDLSAYVGKVVKVNGGRICYSVTINPDVVGAIPITVYSDFVDGDACLLSLESTNDFVCADDEEEEIIEPTPAQVYKPIDLNTYYQSKFKLDQLVREYIIERGEETEHSYPRLLQLAINGLRELNMDVSGHAKMIVLTVNDDMTVDLPQDFINYIKIAVCGADGNLMSLGHNPKMCLPRHSDDCGNIVHGQSQSNQTYTNGYGADIGSSSITEGLTNNFRNGELVGKFYGLGGGQNTNGQYRLDKQRGVIQLSSVVGSEIVLEYVADISRIDGSFTVHPYIVETLKSYLAWASIRRKLNVNLSEKELARRDYYNERRISGMRFNSFTIEEAMATIRSSFRLSPKM